MKKPQGKVYVVGAGPGDVGLITQRGFELLKIADVVVMDALVNPHLLKDTRAKVIYAGKRGPGAPSGSSVDMSQNKINQLLVRLARRGLLVIRLKGGDPFVFGRGSEELEALRAAQVSYEVVPGVSSAVAAPAYAGIPVTDRRWASQVTIVTGREGKEKPSGSKIDWKRISPHGTLIILMGVSRWPDLRKKLLSSGWRGLTPVAAVESGTTARQRVILTTLNNSAVDFQAKKLIAPSIVVVGQVASLHQTLSWVHRERPLLGRRIIVTRPLDQSREFVSKLEEKGAEVIVSPAIRIQPLSPRGGVAALTRKLKKNPARFDWIILLSANAVENFAFALGAEKNFLRKASFLAIGPRTAQAARAQGWKVKKTAKDFNSFGVQKELGNVRGKSILIPRVQNAPPGLTQALRKNGANVQEVSTYKTLPIPPSPLVRKWALNGVDCITFTSGSTARFFLNYFLKKDRRRIFQKATAVSIGPMTSAALREGGVHNILETQNSTTDGMVEALCEFFASSNG